MKFSLYKREKQYKWNYNIYSPLSFNVRSKMNNEKKVNIIDNEKKRLSSAYMTLIEKKNL